MKVGENGGKGSCVVSPSRRPCSAQVEEGEASTPCGEEWKILPHAKLHMSPCNFLLCVHSCFSGNTCTTSAVFRESFAKYLNSKIFDIFFNTLRFQIHLGKNAIN